VGTVCIVLAGCIGSQHTHHVAAGKLPQISGPLNAKNSFYTYPQIESKLASWRKTYNVDHNPSLIKVTSIGKSWEGRDIYAMKISHNAERNDRDKPDVLLIGGIHASEWIGIETMMYFAERLLTGYGEDDYITYILDNAEIWIVPVVNPDGFVYSQKKGDDKHRLWRKNRRPLKDGGIGVDLNRSFPHRWRLSADRPDSVADDIGGSDNPDSRFYRGAADPSNPHKRAIVEKETRALINLVDNPRHNFLMAIDYHSYCEKIFYPPSYSRELPSKDMETFRHIAEGMAELINRQRGKVRGGLFRGLLTPENRYEALQSGRFYTEVCTGTSIDFFYETRGLIALGVELSPGFSLANYRNGKGYKISAKEIVPVGEENFPAMLMAVDWAIGPARMERITVRQAGKTAYEAHWNASGEIVDSAGNSAITGKVDVALVFSKPVVLHPRYALVRNGVGVRNVSLVGPEGTAFNSSGPGKWSRTSYQNDTFTVSINVPEATGDRFKFDLAAFNIALRDSNGFDLDLEPGTRAVYVTGEGLWINYEKTKDHKPPINHERLVGKIGR
jgi:hypothetical protein